MNTKAKENLELMAAPGVICKHKITLVREDAAEYFVKFDKLTSAKDVDDFAHKIYDAMQIELLETGYLLALNTASMPIGYIQLSTGGTKATHMDPVIVFTYLLNVGASRFILIHNHPSGNNKPSQQDIDISKKMKEAGKIMNIELLDHVIITPTPGKYYSLADNLDI